MDYFESVFYRFFLIVFAWSVLGQAEDLSDSSAKDRDKGVPASRLVFKDQVAYLRSDGKAAPFPYSGTAYLRTKAFTKVMNYSNGLLNGTELTRGKNWDRMVTYSNGVLHGKELLTVGSRRFYNFNYVNGEIDVTTLEVEPPEKRKPEYYKKLGNP
jgi:hypothetical protein